MKIIDSAFRDSNCIFLSWQSIPVTFLFRSREQSESELWEFGGISEKLLLAYGSLKAPQMLFTLLFAVNFRLEKCSSVSVRWKLLIKVQIAQALGASEDPRRVPARTGRAGMQPNHI